MKGIDKIPDSQIRRAIGCHETELRDIQGQEIQNYERLQHQDDTEQQQ